MSETTATSFQTLESVKEACEKDYLLKVLQHTHGARLAAADILGISRKNLWEKIKKHNISDEEIQSFREAS